MVEFTALGVGQIIPRKPVDIDTAAVYSFGQRTRSQNPVSISRNMKKFAVFVVLASLMASATAVQAKENAASAAVRALVGVPAPEVAATVVKVVKEAPKAGRPAVVDALVRRVAKTNPSMLRSVVAAVAKADASMASVAAAAASRVHPSAVRDYVLAAAEAAPTKAGEIIALCSRVTVMGRGALAEVVAGANPALNATLLAQEANAVKVTVTGAADAVTGGFIFFPQPSGEIIGYTILGDEIQGDPTPTTGVNGQDSDRDPAYAGAGS